METVLKSVVLIFIGTMLLRFAGRKSLSQMTVAQTVIMISIGSIIIQPITTRGIPNTAIAATTFVAATLLMEYLQVKFNWFEKFMTGQSKTVIENGQLNVKNMKKLRMSVDLLETRLRQNGITKISDVKYATLEPNGQLGYELIDSAKPVTKADLQKIFSYFETQTKQQPNQGDLFKEVQTKQHDIPVPKQLH
ncbi:DUF421 domain-containing protein [Bacillus sp. HMF5848]|uniref:DUF421 domain-containing protein n=1 Tax=Bacillus sp. HMF5848 TaxID=2495421 RepID=UPI000F76DCBD|nr:YetF domain-containing protein [Bacillus sp. HMF5848]RSK26706.1 DUF421 domain-containing protein [Bacillus sp. HMF5848]